MMENECGFYIYFIVACGIVTDFKIGFGFLFLTLGAKKMADF